MDSIMGIMSGWLPAPDNANRSDATANETMDLWGRMRESNLAAAGCALFLLSHLPEAKDWEKMEKQVALGLQSSVLLPILSALWNGSRKGARRKRRTKRAAVGGWQIGKGGKFCMVCLVHWGSSTSALLRHQGAWTRPVDQSISAEILLLLPGWSVVYRRSLMGQGLYEQVSKDYLENVVDFF